MTPQPSHSDYAGREAALDRINDDPAWAQRAYGAAMTRDEATNIVRSIFRRCGYAIAEHGTRGRDLDLVAVPWTDRAGMPGHIVGEVIEALDGAMIGEPERKPYGRVSYAIRPSPQRRHDMWYVDLAVVVPEQYCDDVYPLMEKSR